MFRDDITAIETAPNSLPQNRLPFKLRVVFQVGHTVHTHDGQFLSSHRKHWALSWFLSCWFSLSSGMLLSYPLSALGFQFQILFVDPQFFAWDYTVKKITAPPTILYIHHWLTIEVYFNVLFFFFFVTGKFLEWFSFPVLKEILTYRVSSILNFLKTFFRFKEVLGYTQARYLFKNIIWIFKMSFGEKNLLWIFDHWFLAFING